ncbi:MAG TPA: hypothetical protein VHI52_00160, partial [Verrucomicrobiae bacterium]|nr:hypothetical protein [Verrucomicrobiae bacterium]
NNVLTYFPNGGFSGTDTFTYAAWDGAKNSTLVTGSVLVVQKNAPFQLTATYDIISRQALTLTWAAANNSRYRVQYKTSLGETNWSDLSGDVVASGNTASKTDILTGSNRFYRIKLLP